MAAKNFAANFFGGNVTLHPAGLLLIAQNFQAVNGLELKNFL